MKKSVNDTIFETIARVTGKRAEEPPKPEPKPAPKPKQRYKQARQVYMTPEELAQAFDDLNLTRNRAAEELDVSLATLYTYLNGTQPIPKTVALAVKLLTPDRFRRKRGRPKLDGA
jgi:hypothetical protein